ncbi:glycosyltransferase family 1 protein [Enterococcus sp. AZ196]
MASKKISQITLFTMGKINLEKRISQAYAESSDADAVIQYIVAVLIRQSLCISDFSDFCSELIREIFLYAEPTDVLRKLCPLFRDSFKGGKEWEEVTRRLYKNKNEYHRFNNRLSECKKYLFVPTTPVEETDGQQYKLLSTFEDAVGKIHTWSLRDADIRSSGMKIDAVLELMSSLTIFEKDGIRRFVKLENSEIQNCTRHPKIKKGAVVDEAEQIHAVATQPKMEAATGLDFSTMTDEEKLKLVKALLPEGIVLTDTRMAELKEEAPKEEVRTASKSEGPVAAAQKAEPTNKPAATIVNQAPKAATKKAAESRPMALSAAEKMPYKPYQKPKSKAQQERERKEELMKRTPEGKKASRSKKEKKKQTGKGKPKRKRK